MKSKLIIIPPNETAPGRLQLFDQDNKSVYSCPFVNDREVDLEKIEHPLQLTELTLFQGTRLGVLVNKKSAQKAFSAKLNQFDKTEIFLIQ